MTKLITLAVMLAIPAPVSAQMTCGWSAEPASDRLPATVEAIIAQLPGAFNPSGEIIGNLERWYRACDATAGRQAIFDMRREMERYRGNQAVSALMGSALTHGPEVQIEGVSGITNRPMYHMTNSERDGARLLARASHEPGLDAAAIELAEVALGTRHEPTVKLAVETVRKVAAATGRAGHWHMLAELQFVSADYKAAAATGRKAVELGDSAALHAVAIASLMIDADPAAAARTYDEGLRHASAIPFYYDDISYLLQPSDTAEWRQLSEEERGPWIRQQWEWRAATSSQTVAARLKEHFKRLTHAFEYFPRTAFSTPPGFDAVTFDIRTRRMSIDDRGLIYVRHGPPDRYVRMGLRSADDTRVAWGYWSLGVGRVLFEFTKNDCRTIFEGKCAPLGDYYLTMPVPCNLGAAVTYLGYASDVVQFDPQLAHLMAGCAASLDDGSAGRDPRERGRPVNMDAIAEGLIALRTESAARDLVDPLAALVKTYAMREGDRTVLIAAAALDGSVIRPREGTSDYGLSLMLSVEHPATRSVQKVDTTLAFATAAPMTEGQAAHVRIATPAQPDADATVRFTVRNINDPRQGQIITTAREIPDLSDSGMKLSDLVIASTRDGSWVRGDVRLAPLPAHQVAEGDAFRLYHELYGAANGDPLDVEITIAPGASSSILESIRSLIQRRTAQQITFSDRAVVDGGGTARLTREVATDLEPGRYVVIVKVRNVRLQTDAEARTELIVIRPAER